MASKVLNPLYLLPLRQCSLFHDIVEITGFGTEERKEECLFANPQTYELIRTARPQWLGPTEAS